MRGLKFALPSICFADVGVAPFTGAWIEIYGGLSICDRKQVAPFTGAWIEITFLLADIPDIAVAPFTGAWIEMSTKPIQGYTEPMSHPSRVRGLKCASFIAVHSLM